MERASSCRKMTATVPSPLGVKRRLFSCLGEREGTTHLDSEREREGVELRPRWSAKLESRDSEWARPLASKGHGRGRAVHVHARPSACPRALGRDQLPREWPRSRHSCHSGDATGRGAEREEWDDI